MVQVDPKQTKDSHCRVFKNINIIIYIEGLLHTLGSSLGVEVKLERPMPKWNLSQL